MQVVENAAQVAEAARELVIGCLEDALKARRHASLALSGGSTPKALYQLFAKHGDAQRLQPLDIFFGDERAVPPDHLSSNARMAQDVWLAASGLDPARIHRMRGEAADLDAEAARYANEMTAVLGTPPVLDVVLLGMGDDGHTASMFPGTPPTREQSRFVLALHDGAPEFKRLTFTPPVLAAARALVVMVAGPSKADRLKQVLYAPVNVEALPIQLAVREHPRCFLVCDQDAAIELRNMRA